VLPVGQSIVSGVLPQATKPPFIMPQAACVMQTPKMPASVFTRQQFCPAAQDAGQLPASGPPSSPPPPPPSPALPLLLPLPLPLLPLLLPLLLLPLLPPLLLVPPPSFAFEAFVPPPPHAHATAMATPVAPSTAKRMDFMDLLRQNYPAAHYLRSSCDGVSHPSRPSILRARSPPVVQGKLGALRDFASEVAREAMPVRLVA
jgi:hypothetical protein